MLLIMAVYSIKRGNQDADLPTHQGKTVEEWFYGTNGHPGMERGKTATRLAFDAMGTNCIPYLIRKASTRETVSNRLYCWLYKELPSRWRAKLRFPATASYIQSIAWMYIYDLELKKDTSPMAKDILEAVRQIEDDRVRPEALRMAGWLVSRTYGSTAKTYLFPFLQDPRSDVQVEAA